MVGVRVASHWINVFLLGTSECAAVLGVLTPPPPPPPTCVTRNTSHKKQPKTTHIHRQSYQFSPNCGVPLVITSSYLINTCRAWSGWTSIVYCFRTIVIVSCLYIYKCTVVPGVPDFRVACILSSLLTCQLRNLRFHQWILCYSFSANCGKMGYKKVIRKDNSEGTVRQI